MLEVQHPVDYFKKEREVNEPVEGEQHTEQISKSHEFKRNRRVDTHFSTGQQGLQLPENFEIGEAVGRGDCFFDSFRQGLEQQKGIEVTVKQLREDCRNFARSSPPEWFINTIANSHDNNGEVRSETPDSYIGNILNSDRWGNPEVEGRILCQEYSVKLHIAERHIVEKQEICTHQIVDESGSRSTNDINYNEANTIHIVNGGNLHFQPILKTRNTAQVSNIDEKDENPEPMEVEQPGTSEQAGKKRPSIGEEDQSMVKKVILSPQEGDKLAHEYVKYFTIKFQAIIKLYKNYQEKTLLEMVNRDEAKRVVSEILSGIVSALPGVFTHNAHKHGAIPAMTATSKNIFFPYVDFIVKSFIGKKKQNMEIKKKLEAITKDKSDEDLNEEVLEAAAKIFYMYKTTLNDDNVKKLAEVAVDKIILYIEKNTVDEIKNIENLIFEAIKQKGELVEEHLKVYDEPTDPFTTNEIEKVKRLKESVLSELKPNKALDKVEVQKAVEEELENFYKKKESEKQPPKDITFDLNKPIEDFTGREKDLKDLHEKLSGQNVAAITQKISELSINSQTSNSGNLGSNSQQASVSGLGGIGKTQLALKYAEKYSTDYDNNVIWINAQDEETISNSFKRLASKLGIAKKDVDDDEKKTHDLAQEIYEHFKEAKSLFIFDNVKNYRQIEKYLPKQFVGNKPSILITSRYRNWENTRVEVLDLNVFTLEEAKGFIKTKLKIASGDSLQDEKIDALAEKLGRLPLALAQAVAYIKQQSKNTNSEFGINNYLAIYDEKNKQLLGSNALKESNDLYTETVLTTWRVTLDKIEEVVNGQKAIEILNIMAYFNPDEISNKIFSQLESSGNVDRAIQLLKEYSMINEAKPNESHIHRLVQEVVRINLEDENKEKDILKKALTLIEKFRNKDSGTFSRDMEIHYLHIAYYANSYDELKEKYEFISDKKILETIISYYNSHLEKFLKDKSKNKENYLKFVQEALGLSVINISKDSFNIVISHLKNEIGKTITNEEFESLLSKKEYIKPGIYEKTEGLKKFTLHELIRSKSEERGLSNTEKKSLSDLTKELEGNGIQDVSKPPLINIADSDDSQHSSESKDKTSEEEELPDIDEFPTPTECSLSQRKKRSANVLCWEDIDEFNEAEEPEKRNPNKIEIDSKKFIDYLKGASEEKQDQLIQLAGKVEVTGDAKEAVGRLVKHQKIKSHLRKVGEFSRKLNSRLMIENIGADIVNGNYKDVAVNLGLIGGGQVFGKAADKVLAKGVALEADKKLLSSSLKAASPFLKHGTAGFFAYDLINQIREYKNGNKDALPGIISNGIFVGMDAAEAGVEAAEFLEVIEGVSEFTGPIGEAIGASIFLGMEIYHARKQVEEIEKHVHLTEEEELTEGVRAFFGMAPSKEIEERMEVKERNNQLVKNAIEFLKQNTDFVRYVFPSIKEKKEQFLRSFQGNKLSVDDCKRYTCKLEYEKNINMLPKLPAQLQVTRVYNVTFPLFESSFIDLREKERYIKISDSAPDEGSLFCFEGTVSENLMIHVYTHVGMIPIEHTRGEPVASKVKFLCEYAIGVEYKINRTGDKTLIVLDEERDTAIGTPYSPNIFIANNGYKNYTGGNKDDTFILQANNIIGILNGMGGIDTLDLRGFGTKYNNYALVDENGLVCISGFTQCSGGLKIGNIERIYGRKNKKDGIYIAKDLKYVDGLGSKSNNSRDLIYITNKSNTNPTIVVRNATSVFSNVSFGQVNSINYIIPKGEKGEASILFHFKELIPYKLNFDYSLSNLKSIRVMSYDVIFNLVDQQQEFKIRVSDPWRTSENGQPIKTFDFPKSARYIFQDCEVKILNRNNFYSQQSTNKTAEEIITEYQKIANRLKMTMQFTLPNNETVLVGHGAHEVMHNNPLYKSHLVGNGGENVYVITSAFDTAIPEVTLYNLNTGDFIDTLDLRKVVQQAKIECPESQVSLKVNKDNNDLIIKLYSNRYFSSGKCIHLSSEFLISSVILKGALLNEWYKKLHIVLNRAPMKIKGDGHLWNLEPLPLVFDKDKEIVITPDDIEQDTELVIPREVDNYTFARLRNDLIITNVFDQEESQHCTILLKGFYQEQKMRTLSIKFADKEINFRQHEMQINNATNFDALQEEHKNVRGSILNTTGLQKTTTTVNPEISTHHIRHEHHNSSSRNRRAIDENREENVVSAATKTSSWINVGISWLKKPITNTYAAAKGVYSSFADYVIPIPKNK